MTRLEYKAVFKVPGPKLLNRTCPCCGGPNHMEALPERRDPAYSCRCTNCNRYFTESDFYVGKHEKKPQ